MGEIEEDVGLMRAVHDDCDRAGDDIARGKLRPRVEVGHEPPAVAIDQPRARTANGLGMLLYQGAAALELWTGQPAPIEVMREALGREIYGDRR